MKKTLLGLAFLGALLVGVPAARAADEPSLQDVKNAVHQGRLADAEAMMQTVLRDHPNNAKAHFVDAEVLERLGRLGEARRELARAEQIQPGLASIPPETVVDLRSRLAVDERPLREVRSAAPAADSGIAWAPIVLLIGLGVIAFLVLRARRNAMMAGTSMVPPGATPYAGPAGMPYGAPPMGGPGIGSGILGGLATGAAVGAGMVAGEALAHEFIGNHDHDRVVDGGWNDGSSRVASADTSDLGVDGNWDSGGSGDFAGGMGGDDWG
jgi:hypothetical protein